MLTMTIYHDFYGSDVVQRVRICCFDVEDALDKLKALIPIIGAEHIMAIATDFPFEEGWKLVIDAS